MFPSREASRHIYAYSLFACELYLTWDVRNSSHNATREKPHYSVGDDPCCWLDGFPRPSTVAIGGVHTSFFMSETELVKQLTEVREKGFDESFAHFCAKTFSSHEYPPENLAAAKMHAFYLRMAVEMLTDEESREVLLSGAGVEGGVDAAFRELTRKSLEAAVKSERPFCEVFVERWCRHWAGDE